MFSRQDFSVYFFLFMAVLTLRTTDAYTMRPNMNNNNRKSAAGRRHYAPPSTPTSQTAPMIAQKMLKKTVGGERERGNNWKLSHSVLASCDTLPSFPTAHGILSPETVSRMDDMTDGGYGNEAVSSFLKSYRQHGPMSCLEMLSDPEVLPHLTKAMRDIA